MMNEKRTAAQVRRSCWWPPVVITMAAVVLLLGCSSGNSIFKPTITQQHASERIDQILQHTIGSLSPKPRLKRDHPQADFGNCLIQASGSDTRKQVNRGYILLGVRSANASIARQVLQLWKQAGYTILDTHEIDGDIDSIHGVTKDNFLIALQWTDAGDFTIGATSPCLWPNGTPPPGR